LNNNGEKLEHPCGNCEGGGRDGCPATRNEVKHLEKRSQGRSQNTKRKGEGGKRERGSGDVRPRCWVALNRIKSRNLNQEKG